MTVPSGSVTSATMFKDSGVVNVAPLVGVLMKTRGGWLEPLPAGVYPTVRLPRLATASREPKPRTVRAVASLRERKSHPEFFEGLSSQN